MSADPGETYLGTIVNSQFVIAAFNFYLKDIGKYLNLLAYERFSGTYTGLQK